MEIGSKIKELRLSNGLTQEELANRCELTKGYISQLENDLTSPSIATLTDILAFLGSSLKKFFADDETEQTVFKKDDYFTKDSGDGAVTWLIPTAQKYSMEPILLSLLPGGTTDVDTPHDGEEFGYVLSGKIKLKLGKAEHVLKKGESFYYAAARAHSISNAGKDEAKVIWVSCPPNF